MNAHTPKRDICHADSQAKIDTLLAKVFYGSPNDMTGDFRTALLQHIEKHETNVTHLAAATGVSRDAINKLRAREGSTTNVENAMLIAAYYGKTVNQFVSMKPASEASVISALVELMRPEEQQRLAGKIREILAERARK